MAVAKARERLATLAASVGLLAAALLPGSSTSAVAAGAALVADPASVVNPFMTTGGGNDFPGVDVPFGMVQWSPDTTPTAAGRRRLQLQRHVDHRASA